MTADAARLAIDGGTPVRERSLPYGRQSVSEADVEAVTEVLRSDWLTTGPTVDRFERAFAATVGAAEAVAVADGTAALHAAYDALELTPGDEVVVPAMTFAATANGVLFAGGTPVFADVEPDTLLVDPAAAEAAIGERTRALVAVDYAGQPASYDALRELAERHGLALVADSCHALGATWHGRPIGSIADLTTFSFHPVKPVTSAEGGMIATDDPARAQRMRRFRNHGISTDHRERIERGIWRYEMEFLGYNYRLTDLQCALGLSQLGRLAAWTERRRQIAARYDRAFAGRAGLETLAVKPDRDHAYHLYVVQVEGDRGWYFRALRAEGIGVNVHYLPVHLHPYYRDRFGTGPGLCPVAEAAYERILTLPIFPTMDDADIDDVIAAMEKVLDRSPSR